MRIVTLIFVLMIMLVGFGYLLEHSINLDRQLSDTRDQLARAQSDLQTLQVQYQALVQENDRLNGQVASLTGENSGLKDRITAIEGDRTALLARIDTLQKQVDRVKQAEPLFAWLLSGSRETKAAAFLLIPLVPMTLGAIYVMIHPSTGSTSDGVQTILTRDELHLIAQRRRLGIGRK